MQSSLSLGARSAFRSAIFALVSSSPLALSTALAQQAAAPAATLDPITVEGQQAKQKKKAAKAGNKAKAKATAKASAEPLPIAATEAASGAGGTPGDATKPGLNLDVPTKTGSRLGLTPLQTPASVEVISGQTLRERGQTNSIDAVTQNATGFTSQASPGNGGTGLATRGFAGHGSVMQLYDGTRMPVGNGTVSFPYDTWSAERIEVLRGPASVLYGEGAIGGVINVVPKKPTDFFVNEAEIGIDTFGKRRFGLGSGGPISDTVSYRFDASGHKSEGWLDSEGDFEALNLSGALSWRASRDLRFTVSHDYADQSPLRYWGTPLINGRIQDRLRDENFNVRDSKVNYRDAWTQFKTEWDPTEWLSLRNVAYRITSDRHWRNVESYSHVPATGLISRTDYLEIIHDHEQYGNRFDATFRAALGGGMKNEFVAGFDINRTKYGRDHNFTFPDHTSVVDPYNPDPGVFVNVAGTTPEFESDIDQVAFFAENHLTVSKKLSLIGGIRQDRSKVDRHDLRGTNDFVTKFDDITWRAGAVYTPVPGLAFYGQYATAVDPVSGLLSLGFGGRLYKLASGRMIEIGVKNEFWGGRGEWTLAGYDIEKQDILAANPDAPGQTVQIGGQSSRGIEASLALQLTNTLRYEGNVALLDAQFDEFYTNVGGVAVSLAGNRPNNIPEQIVTNWVTWQFFPRWEARAGVQWVGEIYNNTANTVKRPSSTVVNLGLDYDVTDKSVIALNVFNVFDEVYATGSSSTAWQLAPPRSAELSYRIKF